MQASDNAYKKLVRRLVRTLMRAQGAHQNAMNAVGFIDAAYVDLDEVERFLKVGRQDLQMCLDLIQAFKTETKGGEE